ncbi:ParB/RepB/Spo0J family partition protein [Mucisphaera calidilacus]|uniref:Putative chromosome-partitioning protein ParB n=1 Tax=Mucisphaera calidilacus TaxID=2527982 RepID=A0A518C0J3_9BACT|nr:ParB/RepB/Spo0J family partition protein [Mucisphaera calidilacus]QDU72743.1 putative chromosome-partitioning protein ParB [Mucisphaera calidilacus]
MVTKRPSRLGKGLASLVSQPVSVQPPAASEKAAAAAASSDAEVIHRLLLEDLEPNPFQPRQDFDPARLRELADSIRSQGVMQPVTVRKKPGEAGRYQIIAGERRWRAAKLAGLERIPALLQALEDQQAAEWALIENLQREDLNPIERAKALQELIHRHGLSHDRLGQQIGLERSTVTNLLRLLSLAEPVQDHLRSERLAMGHARALAAVSDLDLQAELADRAVREGWSVRRVESEVKRAGRAQDEAPSVKREARGVHLAAFEQHILQHTGLKASIKPTGKKGGGKLTLAFDSPEGFMALLGRLGVPEPEEGV